MKICLVKGCMGIHYGNGYCNKHYQQIRKHGKITNGLKKQVRRKYQEFNIIENGRTIKAYTFRNEPFYLDIEDFPLITDAIYSISLTGYPTANYNKINTSLHIRIMNAPEGMEVDHIDGDKLNNRKKNLRICTHQQNLWNSKIRSDNTSGGKGLYLNKRDGTWTARIQCEGIIYYLGTYKDKDKAIKIRKQREKELFGEFACQR